MNLNDVPADFPRVAIPAVVTGVQPKIGVREIGGRYVVGQTEEERYERWDICEDLAWQLLPVAQKDEAGHPGQKREATLRRVRISVSQKGWCSEDELDWLIRRLAVLLQPGLNGQPGRMVRAASIEGCDRQAISAAEGRETAGAGGIAEGR